MSSSDSCRSTARGHTEHRALSPDSDSPAVRLESSEAHRVVLPEDSFPICAIARSIVDSSAETDFALGLTERALVTLDALPGPRSVRTPTYLTDLGMRIFSGPGEFFSLHASELTSLGWAEPATHLVAGNNASWLQSASDDDVAHALDSLVLLAGAYSEATDIARDVVATGRVIRSPRLAIYLATLLARSQPQTARGLLSLARSLAVTVEELFAAELRRAAVTAKRQDDMHRATSELRALDYAIDSHDQLWQLSSDGDKSMMHAMVANLRALTQMKMDEPWQALESARRAVQLAQADGLSGETANRAGRYLVQVTGNNARLAWVLGQHVEAENLWRTNVANARLRDTDSLGEALYGLAYGTYLLGRFDESVAASTATLKVVKSEASPARLRQTRKVLVAAAAKAGDSSLSAETLDAMTTDPLGRTE